MLPLEAAVNAAFAEGPRQTQTHAVLAGSCRCGRRLTLFCRELSEQNSFAANFFSSLSFLACDAMVTSFHFPGRPGKETKQRKGAAGQAKNKRAAHTVRPAPTPGPLILTLTFPIHFDDHIKRITRLRTFPIHSPASAPSGHNGKHPRMAPKGPTRLSSNTHIPNPLVWLRRM